MSAMVASRPALAARVLALLDLTSLGEDDTPEQIEALCARARAARVLPAALCIYPEHVTTVRRALRGSPIKVAAVVNFPDGSADSMRISRETRRALAAGADEIDLVFPYHAYLHGNELLAARAIAACRHLCRAGVILKLILETGELGCTESIARASRIGIDGGVDFLKTSTGKGPINASPAAVVAVLDAIAKAGGDCGLKVSGGICTLADAITYLDLVASRMGAAWITPTHFRIGASLLFGELTAALNEAE